ncbi:hypothetical protein EV421DRAFT_1669593, partial [Armillaria borealis]
GDTVGQNAQWLLDHHGFYPGDHLEALTTQGISSPYGQFHVNRILDTHHSVTDRLYWMTDEDEDLIIPTLWLEREGFNMVLWYAIIRGE